MAGIVLRDVGQAREPVAEIALRLVRWLCRQHGHLSRANVGVEREQRRLGTGAAVRTLAHRLLQVAEPGHEIAQHTLHFQYLALDQLIAPRATLCTLEDGAAQLPRQVLAIAGGDQFIDHRFEQGLFQPQQIEQALAGGQFTQVRDPGLEGRFGKTMLVALQFGRRGSVFAADWRVVAQVVNEIENETGVVAVQTLARCRGDRFVAQRPARHRFRTRR